MDAHIQKILEMQHETLVSIDGSLDALFVVGLTIVFAILASARRN